MTDPVLICGGAGFIGTNLAVRLLSLGRPVIVYDDLSRRGVERNLEWVKHRFGSLVDIELADIRDSRTLRRSVRRASAVFHLAAQTAVTTSLVTPLEDFEVNATGTVRLLEEIRSLPYEIPLVFTSTNKVYGNLEKLALRLTGDRYEPQHPGVLANGIDESWPLDFHSPYGCSKGSADQYVLDYARSFALPNVVFRMSCIYGPHQCGNEDQGWVAHFALQAMHGRTITIYGDGRQVRDVLFVDDLVDALLLASEHAKELRGRAFNIGGGPANSVSVLQVLHAIADLEGKSPKLVFNDWRIGDQRYYVSDTSAFRQATGWAPRFDARTGIAHLHQWLASSRLGHRSGIGAVQQGVA